MINKKKLLFISKLAEVPPIGSAKYAPGTIASFVALIIGYFFLTIFNIFLYLSFIFIFIIFSYFLCEIHIKKHNKKDPKEIVIDEFIGQSIPIYLYEISHGTNKDPNEAIIFYVVCFVLFRYFDIMKPFPVSYFDKKHKNSFGVIMDDVCAGLYVVLSLICFMILKNFIL